MFEISYIRYHRPTPLAGCALIPRTSILVVIAAQTTYLLKYRCHPC